MDGIAHEHDDGECDQENGIAHSEHRCKVAPGKLLTTRISNSLVQRRGWCQKQRQCLAAGGGGRRTKDIGL